MDQRCQRYLAINRRYLVLRDIQQAMNVDLNGEGQLAVSWIDFIVLRLRLIN